MVKDTTVENRHGLERSHFQSSKIKPVGVILGYNLSLNFKIQPVGFHTDGVSKGMVKNRRGFMFRNVVN
jgi:hypothetical protein